MRKIAPLFQPGHSSNSNTCTHPRSKHTWSKAPRQAPFASAAVHLINNPQQSWAHEEAILTIPVLDTQPQMQGAWVGTRSYITILTIVSTPSWPKASAAWSNRCTTRPNVGLIAWECTEHDKERKSISIVEEPVSQVVRKLHGTRPRSRRWAQIW